MVDIIQYTSYEELKQIMPRGFKKSDTLRIDDLQANKIEAKMHNEIIIPGGSEANVIADIASLGGKTSFNTIIAKDKLGILFKESLSKAGVDFKSYFAKNTNKGTARCFTFITPDKDRTFAVSASITQDINDSFIDYEAIKNSKIFYTDSTNLNHGGSKSKITLKALNLAKVNKTITVFNLANHYFVETYRDEIINLLPKVDILVGSETEAKSLLKAKSLDEAIARYLEYSPIVIITLGKKGAKIATKTSIIHIDTATDKNKIIDLNGAGDGFIAGFLYGYTHNYTLKESGELGAKTAAQIIYQIGGRPTKKLKDILL